MNRAGPSRLQTQPGVLATVAAVLRVLVVGVFVLTFLLQSYRIPSASMVPTLDIGDCVLVSKTAFSNAGRSRGMWSRLAYELLPRSPVQRGDLMVFHYPPQPSRLLVKRVIGLPGDRVSLSHGRVYIDGKRLDESYLDRSYLRHACGSANATTAVGGRSRWTVPKNDLFVMGDDRCNSTDSRIFGPIPESSVIGRAFVIVWPLGRFRFL